MANVGPLPSQPVNQNDSTNQPVSSAQAPSTWDPGAQLIAAASVAAPSASPIIETIQSDPMVQVDTTPASNNTDPNYSAANTALANAFLGALQPTESDAYGNTSAASGNGGITPDSLLVNNGTVTSYPPTTDGTTGNTGSGPIVIQGGTIGNTGSPSGSDTGSGPLLVDGGNVSTYNPDSAAGNTGTTNGNGGNQTMNPLTANPSGGGSGSGNGSVVALTENPPGTSGGQSPAGATNGSSSGSGANAGGVAPNGSSPYDSSTPGTEYGLLNGQQVYFAPGNNNWMTLQGNVAVPIDQEIYVQATGTQAPPPPSPVDLLNNPNNIQNGVMGGINGDGPAGTPGSGQSISNTYSNILNGTTLAETGMPGSSGISSDTANQSGNAAAPSGSDQQSGTGNTAVGTGSDIANLAQAPVGAAQGPDNGNVPGGGVTIVASNSYANSGDTYPGQSPRQATSTPGTWIEYDGGYSFQAGGPAQFGAGGDFGTGPQAPNQIQNNPIMGPPVPVTTPSQSPAAVVEPENGGSFYIPPYQPPNDTTSPFGPPTAQPPLTVHDPNYYFPNNGSSPSGGPGSSSGPSGSPYNNGDGISGPGSSPIVPPSIPPGTSPSIPPGTFPTDPNGGNNSGNGGTTGGTGTTLPPITGINGDPVFGNGSGTTGGTGTTLPPITGINGDPVLGNGSGTTGGTGTTLPPITGINGDPVLGNGSGTTGGTGTTLPPITGINGDPILGNGSGTTGGTGTTLPPITGINGDPVLGNGSGTTGGTGTTLPPITGINGDPVLGNGSGTTGGTGTTLPPISGDTWSIVPETPAGNTGTGSNVNLPGINFGSGNTPSTGLNGGSVSMPNIDFGTGTGTISGTSSSNVPFPSFDFGSLNGAFDISSSGSLDNNSGVPIGFPDPTPAMRAMTQALLTDTNNMFSSAFASMLGAGSQPQSINKVG